MVVFCKRMIVPDKLYFLIFVCFNSDLANSLTKQLDIKT